MQTKLVAPMGERVIATRQMIASVRHDISHLARRAAAAAAAVVVCARELENELG